MTQRTRLAHPWPPWVDASSFSSNIDTNTRKNTLALGRARGTAEAAICEGCEAHDLREMLRRARRSMAKIRPRPRFVNPLPLVFSGRATIARGVMRLPARPHRLLGASPTDRPTTSPWPTRSAPWHRDRRPVRARSTEHMYLCVQVDRRACRVAMATGPDDKLRPTHRQNSFALLQYNIQTNDDIRACSRFAGDARTGRRLPWPGPAFLVGAGWVACRVKTPD